MLYIDRANILLLIFPCRLSRIIIIVPTMDQDIGTYRFGYLRFWFMDQPLDTRYAGCIVNNFIIHLSDLNLFRAQHHPLHRVFFVAALPDVRDEFEFREINQDTADPVDHTTELYPPFIKFIYIHILVHLQKSKNAKVYYCILKRIPENEKRYVVPFLGDTQYRTIK